MFLTTIDAEGIHGAHEYHVALTPVTLITGPNESGKSSLLGLAELAINGPKGKNWPVLGETPDYDWNVSLAFDDNTRLARFGKKHGLTFKGVGGTLKDGQRKVDMAIGHSAMWSVDDFIGLSPAKRMEFMRSEILDGSGWTMERLEEELKSIETKLTDIDALKNAPTDDARARLTYLVDFLRDTWSSLNSDANRLKKVVDTDNAEMKADNRPAGTVPMWNEKRQALDRDIATHQRTIGQAEGQHQARTTMTDQVDAWEKEIGEEQARDYDGEIAAIDDTITNINAEVDGLVSDDLVAAKSAMDDAQATSDGFGGAKATAAEAVRQLRVDLAKLEARQAARDDVAPILDAARSVLEEFDKGVDFVNVNPHQGIMDSITEWLDGAKPEAIQKVLTEVNDGVVADRGAQAQHAAAERVLAEKTRAAQLVNGKIDKLGTRKGDSERKREELATAKNASGEKQTRLARKREDMRAKLDEMGTGDVGGAEVLLKSAQEERVEVQASLDTVNDYQGRRADREKRLGQWNTATSSRTAARELGTTLKAMLGKMLSDIVKPLLDDMDRITRASMGCQVEVGMEDGFRIYLRRLRSAYPDLEEGEVPPRIPFETASHSQQAITMMALRCAIVQRLGGWRSLILDDMEVLERTRRTAFVKAMAEEIDAGRLDSFIGGFVADGWEAPEHAVISVIALEAR